MKEYEVDDIPVKKEARAFNTDSELGKSMKKHCQKPWVSTLDEHPPFWKKVIIASYVGMENLNSQLPGYRVETGYCIDAWVSKKGLYDTAGEKDAEKEEEHEIKVAWVVCDGDSVQLYHRPSRRKRRSNDITYDYGSSAYTQQEYIYLDPKDGCGVINTMYGNDVELETPDFWMYIPPIK